MLYANHLKRGNAPHRTLLANALVFNGAFVKRCFAMRTTVTLAILVFMVSCSTGRTEGLTAPGLVSSKLQPFDPAISSMQLHTKGNRVLNTSNEPVCLRGVNIASLEWGNAGEHVAESANCAIADWKANLIRLPLAQDRWFGKMPDQTDGGLAYRAIVDELVAKCAKARVYIDVELHWSDCGIWCSEGGNLGQHSLPDKHSVEFWEDVATRYQNHPNVIFGLYNEPHDVSFALLRDGGSITDKPAAQRGRVMPQTEFVAVGMQKLYDTVRATGAGNLLTISGTDWGYDLSGMTQGFEIKGRDFVYETHPYATKVNWDKCFGDASRQYPVFIGEFGPNNQNFDPDYLQRLVDYLQQHNVQLWTAWDFHTSAGPTLILNWSYEPTPFGQFVKDLLAKPQVATVQDSAAR